VHRGGDVTDDPWRCRLCGIAYPVQSMARDCELRHIDTSDDQGADVGLDPEAANGPQNGGKR